MKDQLSDQIKLSKKILREKSIDFVLNFKKIEEFIKKYLQIIFKNMILLMQNLEIE